MPAQIQQTSPKRYLYYPGCALKGTGIAYEESLLEVFRLLNLPIEEIQDWNCCGATSYMSVDRRASGTLAARNLGLAWQAGGHDVVAPCSACYLALRRSAEHGDGRASPDLRPGGAPQRRPSGGQPARVRHPLEVIYTDLGLERLAPRVVRPWPGGKVACYYGCQAVRPYGEVDRPHRPHRMDDVLAALGVRTADYPLKTKCCGGTHSGTLHPVGLRLVAILLMEAARRGAEALVTICPLCQFNLEAYQEEVAREAGRQLDIPILYFTQVVGWVLGADARSLGLHRAIAGRKQIDRWFFAHTEATGRA